MSPGGGGPSGLSVRPIELPRERGFVDDVVYLACTWYEPTPELPHPPRAELLASMEVYLEDLGRPGDVCLAAEYQGELVAGAFYRLFPDDRHGHGWIDASTPELGIAVADAYRGTGVGRAVMTTLLATARLEGHARISLHVSEGNRARNLYESLGFRPVTPAEGGWIMVCEFEGAEQR